MDIVTQGVLGAAASQAVFARRLPRSAWLIGCVGGLLADADVLIRPASDPLGGLTYHRHFTHSLIFIPVGALIAAVPFLLFWALWQRRRQTVSQPAAGPLAIYLCALVAYATHGLLDACTSYGTMLFWPFSDVRISWDLIAIIDPAYTLPLLIGVLVSFWYKRPAAARVALVLTTLYMGFGLVQRERVLDAQRELAALRGHTIERGRAIPTPLSLMLWRSVYLTDDGQIVADAVRTPYLDKTTVLTGSSAPQVTIDHVRRMHGSDPKFLAAFETFSWFADGFVAVHEDEPLVLGDMRYCVEPHTMDSLWGFFLGDPEMLVDGPLAFRREPPPDAVPQRMVSFRMSRGDRFARVWKAMIGDDSSFQTLATVRARLTD